MSDVLETISIVIGGGLFRGWSSVKVSVSTDQAARTASIEVADFAEAKRIKRGDTVTVSAGGALMLTGTVRDVNPSHTENSRALAVNFVSNAVDLVEGSIQHKTGFVEKMPLDKIAAEFDTGGVGIVADESFTIEPRSYVAPGASVFDHIAPLARSAGALIYDTPDGKLRLRKKPRGRHSGTLKIGPGGRIVSGSAEFTEYGRHDEVIVRGQSSRGTGAAALQMEAKAKDSQIKRRRPKIILMEGEATSEKMTERAERHVKKQAGASTRATIEVAGWRDDGGKIFEPHFIIAVRDELLGLDQDMAIQTIEFRQDAGGTRAGLTLVDPAAVGGEASQNSASAYATPSVKPELGLPQF